MLQIKNEKGIEKKKSEFKLSTLVFITLYFLALSQSQERIC